MKMIKPEIVNTNKFKRGDLVKFLNDQKIGTRLLFAGNIIKQPYFKNLNYRVSSELKNTDKVMNDSFWLGVYPGLTNEMLDYILNQIEIFLKKI
jgi:CDP-6-deoxy-D-xylo-4-hexulose-3-dehydrase